VGKIPLSTSGGNELLSPGARENPDDASVTFRPGPRAQTEVLPPFFKILNGYEISAIPKSAAEKFFAVESFSDRFDPPRLALPPKRG